MSYTDLSNPIFYPEDYDYSIYYQNEIQKHHDYNIKNSTSRKTQPPAILPTVTYLNERKCPIYVHQIRGDSSVYNNYNEKLTYNGKKSVPQNASKQVLDKLEEKYWATWKPTKHKIKLPKNELDNNTISVKEHHLLFDSKVKSNRPHGDINDNIIKYFKATRFDSLSATDSSTLKKDLVSVKAEMLLQQQDSEIQTELHCPIIHHNNTEEIIEEEPPKEKTPRGKKKNRLKAISNKKDNKEVKKDGAEDNAFAEHKDSIEVIKKKQGAKEPSSPVQQPKCIKLYRKSPVTTGFIKGGTYPLKSCLKKDGVGRGSFRMGAPGSPLFVTTTGSFSNRKKNK